jgi:hypothetical protein
VKRFPEDLIDKYEGEVDWANPNYDQLFLPGDAADEIAEELRARGHQVEKTSNGDLNYWLSSYIDPPVSQTSESTATSSTRLPAFLEGLQAYMAEQAEAEGDEDTEADSTGPGKRPTKRPDNWIDNLVGCIRADCMMTITESNCEWIVIPTPDDNPRVTRDGCGLCGSDDAHIVVTFVRRHTRKWYALKAFRERKEKET